MTNCNYKYWSVNAKDGRGHTYRFGKDGTCYYLTYKDRARFDFGDIEVENYQWHFLPPDTLVFLGFKSKINYVSQDSILLDDGKIWFLSEKDQTDTLFLQNN
jgi:hypothetical protein